MTFQTQQDDKNNGGKNKRTNLVSEICSIWLGLMGVKITEFDLHEVKMVIDDSEDESC